MTLRKTADRMVRSFVLRRDGRCLMCGTEEKLEWCHIISRGAPYIRWEPTNAVTLCHRDHMWFTAHPAAFKDWVRDRYGPDRWDDLLRMEAERERRGDHVDIAAVIRGFREYDLTPAERERYRSGIW